MKSLAHVHGGYRWRIGNGVSVSLWFDAWVYEEPLCAVVDKINPDDILCTISYIITPERAWHLQSLKTALPQSVINQIYKIQLHVARDTRDVPMWKGNVDGIPTAHSFYKFLSYDELDLPSSAWAWIWKIDCPQKLRFFVWLVMHDRLPVNAYRC